MYVCMCMRMCVRASITSNSPMAQHVQRNATAAHRPALQTPKLHASFWGNLNKYSGIEPHSYLILDFAGGSGII